MCNTDRQHRMYCLPICRSWLTEPSVIDGIKHVWGKGDVAWLWIGFFACFPVYSLALRPPLLNNLLGSDVHLFISANCKEDLVIPTRGFQSLVCLEQGLISPRANISWAALQGRLIGLSCSPASTVNPGSSALPDNWQCCGFCTDPLGSRMGPSGFPVASFG